MNSSEQHPLQQQAIKRRIAHLDMDAFYASVALLRYPELRGLPVVIAGCDKQKPVLQADGNRHFFRLRDYAGRGVITTATYEARAAGVFSGMGIMKAAQLAPDAILLPVDFSAYRHYSRLFKTAVTSIAPQIENMGIDEIYIDLSDLPDDTITLAQQIKQTVHKSVRLSCSIGIAPNKLLAKICSNLKKPDGITILDAVDIPDRIWPLPVNKINGIGPKATQKLARLGITTIAELACAELSLLQTYFGRSYAIWLHEASRGIDHRPVITHTEPKSISRETTFDRDLHPHHDRAILSKSFTALCVQVGEDLKRKGYTGRTISIKLRFEDFHTITRDITLTTYVTDPVQIRHAAGKCLKRIPLSRKVRLLGVKVSTLSSIHTLQDAEVSSVQRELPLIM
ncbi:DNA polymerase IV [Nitrosomonas aestuarii]|uniref:DNA polymerase IV n=1 Tax=Nitrosomonas aestuarii TaxID=52441 RepID=UPI000D3082BF|nr:DNA polymerase IV [Nitrosomonas aestuarii]PTN12259.1 DNA polymerase-4 [Nitrosomonas aestuarii]